MSARHVGAPAERGDAEDAGERPRREQRRQTGSPGRPGRPGELAEGDDGDDDRQGDGGRVVAPERFDRGEHVGGADRDGRRPPAEATGRVRHVQVHERAAMQVGEPAPQSAGEPCPASDAEDQPDRAGAAPLPGDRGGGEDHEPDDAVGDTQRRRVGRIGGDPLRHRGDRAGGDQGGDERLGAHRDHPTRAARAGPVSWLLGMNPRAADWRSRRR